MKLVLVTGGFDPLHSGHIEYFTAAKKLGYLLVVGINSDNWLTRKKGRSFMPASERRAIIENLYQVHRVIEFNDNDDTAIDAIRRVKEMYPAHRIVFANGGDRTKDNIPEMVFDDVEFVFGVGGEEKKNSSSWILEEWKAPKTTRTWGYYRVLHEVPGTKVKELTIGPGETLSMQRHFNRHELWHVTDGECYIESLMASGYVLPTQRLTQFSQVQIPQGDWHRLSNPFDKPCRIVEIQYGTECVEEDIERR